MIDDNKHITCTLIGNGKVGKSFTQLLTKNGISVNLLGRDYLSKTDIIKDSDIIIISVNDEAIEHVCESIASSLKPNTIVNHCSGAIESNVLISAQEKGCHIASTHPLNTFPTLEAALNTFANNQHQTYLMAEGDDQALKILLPLFEKLGFQTLSIKTSNKAAYHAATVFACNYLTTLMDLSLQSAQMAGIDKATFWQAVQPLLNATLNNISNNIEQNDIASALSGPIARGDSITLEKHLKAFDANNQNIQKAYSQLASHTIRLAIKRGELEESQIQKMQETLNQETLNKRTQND